ncbi:MAG: bifunctional hydroxymethylpyrimidine kinase/phosphomethylpyrimidine kinase, partial [Cyanobacteria bacterium]|nr:bifunctional hydroxymethylpyrimidine kinase/phosphomethylpyrimidine kinase [Cyanobacteriota bacterium]
GSDSGGGAGIQADLKTMNALGTFGCSVITALTAQNTQTVTGIEITSPNMIKAQLEALSQDLPPQALKIGMVGNLETVEILVDFLKTFSSRFPSSQKPFVLYDPVMISTSGHALMAPEVIAKIRLELLPWVDLLTPNLYEAEKLTGDVLNTPEAIERAGRKILQDGPRGVLIKGGHLAEKFENTPPFCSDYWCTQAGSAPIETAWLTQQKIDSTHTHGTGCTLSAAITACVAQGYEVLDAVVIGKAYITQGIRMAPQLGKGHGPLYHGPWPESQQDMPWMTETFEQGIHPFPPFPFPSILDGTRSEKEIDFFQEPLGFYPIVDRAEWLQKLLPLGVKTIQLRIKDLNQDTLEAEIQEAVALSNQYGCRLFINDHWELALKYKAYGVHLGQFDIDTADFQALSQSGIRLGLSTHCYYEVARALALKPSYIAVGPVFHTTTKTMRFAPQGLAAVARWRKTLNYPLVAIAGIFLENAPSVLDTGVDGLAVVRDITQAQDLPTRVQQWLELLKGYQQSPKKPSPNAALAGVL